MDSEKEAQKPSKRLKRVVGSYATQKSPKKSKVMKSAKDVTEEEAAEYEKEKEELRLSLKIISNDDSEVNYEPLSRKFPIMNWEYQLLGKMEEKDMYAYKLTRAGESSSYHGDTQDFLRRLDRQDLNDLYRSPALVQGNSLEKMLNLQLEAEEESSSAELNLINKTTNSPLVISSALSTTEKARILEVLKNHKRAIAWSIADIKGINSSFYSHKILMEDVFKPSVQPQRRVNLNIKEVVPKKGGMTIVKNGNDELIL
ncbi:hypothetical protein Tco_0696776 [Tanacetum coccineum]